MTWTSDETPTSLLGIVWRCRQCGQLVHDEQAACLNGEHHDGNEAVETEVVPAMLVDARAADTLDGRVRLAEVQAYGEKLIRSSDDRDRRAGADLLQIVRGEAG
jgi:hypothetical protein